MDIRRDFESAAPYLHRLWGLGEEFGRLANDSWPHLKNKEDFSNVYRMENPLRSIFERLYADGRDMAIYMAGHLCGFNSMVDFPSMTAYVDTFQKNWCASVDRHQERLDDLRQYVESPQTPWAVRQMIGLWETQVNLLKATNATVELLKQTDIYRVERGEIKVSDLNKQPINVGVIGNVYDSKVNVASTDKSVNVNISTHEVFANIKDALNKAEIAAPEKQNLIQCVDAMEADVGKKTFMNRYQDFVAAGANHMSLLSPFLPALTSLLG